MGFLDELGELVQNVNDVASDISKSTIDDYGEPEYTLYTARKLERLLGRPISWMKKER